jgi:hypothetical protein
VAALQALAVLVAPVVEAAAPVRVAVAAAAVVRRARPDPVVA